MAEKYLKTNGNDLNATIGDLLAVSAMADEVSLEHIINGSSNGKPNKKAMSLPGGYMYSGGPNTTPTSAGPGSGFGAVSQDHYRQQLMLKALQQQQHQQQSQQQQMSTGGMQAQLNPLQLLHMQQQYRQLPPASVPGYQQFLNRHLAQLKVTKQQLTQQLQLQMHASLQGSVNGQSQHQMLQTKLNLINNLIGQTNQQLMMQKCPGQQKDKGVGLDGGKNVLTGVCSPHVSGPGQPPRNKDIKPVPSRSMSLPGRGSDHSLALSMQGMNLNSHTPISSISQSSARSVSRLQQIISGSSGADSQEVEDTNPSKYRMPQAQSSTTTDSFDSTSPLTGCVSTSASTPFSPVRSFNDIQEFRPGVPWQPRAQPTEPAQVYARTLPHSLSASDMKLQQGESSWQTGGQMPPPGPGVRAQRRPPSHGHGYNNPPGSTMPPRGFKTRPTYSEQSLWSYNSAASQKAFVPPASGSASGPIGGGSFGESNISHQMFPPGGPAFSGRPKQQQQQQMMLSHSAAFHSSGDPAGPPLTRPQALFSSSNNSSSQAFSPQVLSHPSSSSASSSSTASAFLPPASSDTAAQWSSVDLNTHPASSVASVWDSTPSSSSKPWNSAPLPAKSEGASRLPPSVVNPGHLFTSSPHTSSSDDFTPSIGEIWEKEGPHSPHYRSMLGTEPPFPEWQADKTAHLSAFKLPSNPPCEWLLIKNLNSQVCAMRTNK